MRETAKLCRRKEEKEPRCAEPNGFTCLISFIPHDNADEVVVFILILKIRLGEVK